jgi:hypothetical protein
MNFPNGGEHLHGSYLHENHVYNENIQQDMEFEPNRETTDWTMKLAIVIMRTF